MRSLELNGLRSLNLATLALVAASGLVPAAESAPTASALPADLVLLNGRILTVDSRDSIASALAVRGGRIAAIGSDADIRALVGARTRVFDLAGRAATPGLIDTHAHIAEGGLDAVSQIDLSDARSVAEIVRRVAVRAKGVKAGAWIQGTGWDEGKLVEARYVLARDLDAAAPRNPVWLVHTTGHYGTANAVALRLAGLSAASSNPTAGTIDRDAAGSPTGVLKEAAQDLVARLLPTPTMAQRRAGILASLALMGREGMTGVKDPSISAEDWAAYTALARQDQLTAHVCVLFTADPTVAAAAALVARVRALPLPPHTDASGNLMSCGVKIFMDGSGGGRTAWVYGDWNVKSVGTDAGNHGYPLVDPEIFRAQVRLFHDAGIHIGTHAIGDRAIDTTVDAYADALKATPTPGLRHSIIHANIPSDHAIDLMATLQKTYDAGYPESQGPFTWWIGDNYAGNFGAVRAARLNPFQTYVERGMRFGGGSDYPVTPLPARYGLWSSVARETVLGTYGAQPFGTAQSIDVHAALKSYTIWAARQLFIENEAGSLEVGKSADLAVWDRDPYAVPTSALKDMHCELTLFRGRLVYEATDSPIRQVSGPRATLNGRKVSGT
jgi:predicted amidohydrolase YtcJ